MNSQSDNSNVLIVHNINMGSNRVWCLTGLPLYSRAINVPNTGFPEKKQLIAQSNPQTLDKRVKMKIIRTKFANL